MIKEFFFDELTLNDIFEPNAILNQDITKDIKKVFDTNLGDTSAKEKYTSILKEECAKCFASFKHAKIHFGVSYVALVRLVGEKNSTEYQIQAFEKMKHEMKNEVIELHSFRWYANKNVSREAFLATINHTLTALDDINSFVKDWRENAVKLLDWCDQNQMAAETVKTKKINEFVANYETSKIDFTEYNKQLKSPNYHKLQVLKQITYAIHGDLRTWDCTVNSLQIVQDAVKHKHVCVHATDAFHKSSNSSSSTATMTHNQDTSVAHNSSGVQIAGPAVNASTITIGPDDSDNVVTAELITENSNVVRSTEYGDDRMATVDKATLTAEGLNPVDALAVVPDINEVNTLHHVSTNKASSPYNEYSTDVSVMMEKEMAEDRYIHNECDKVTSVIVDSQSLATGLHSLNSDSAVTVIHKAKNSRNRAISNQQLASPELNFSPQMVQSASYPSPERSQSPPTMFSQTQVNQPSTQSPVRKGMNIKNFYILVTLIFTTRQSH
jgi:hypothetical protein